MTSSTSPITCHVLNTLTGKPAANLEAKLTLLASTPQQQPGPSFTATTNADGRITQWEPSNFTAEGSTSSAITTPTVQSILAAFEGDSPAVAADKVAWSLTFDVGAWYHAQGVESFWPQVVVSFYVKPAAKAHYHVPVLVGPWTYTTYRGS
ncbi:hypothetical protein DV736_g5204, partial [Chaetothyriales sp. CBS 134916]